MLIARAIAVRPETGGRALADIAAEVADLVAKFPAYAR